MADNDDFELDVRFAKVGKELINARSMEKFFLLDDDIYLSTTADVDVALPHDKSVEVGPTIKRVVRRMNEDAHDVIYLEAFAQNDEELLSEDQASNLLYRKWLEPKDKPEKRKFFRFNRNKKKD